MSRSSALILLGALVILVPFSGLPIALRTVLAVIFGGAVLGIGLVMRGESARAARRETTVTSPSLEPPTRSGEITSEPAPESHVPHGVSPI